MRGHNLTTDMDFRVIPSAIPLQSPSPDRKSINVITPTISPNALEIKKSSTPINSLRTQKQNRKHLQQADTQIKYYSQSPNMQYSSILKQKDQIILHLRSIINIITENGRHKKSIDAQDQDLKNQVKILTIQNQKLVNIIEKMNKNKSIWQSQPKIQEYELKIKQLTKSLKQTQYFHQEEAKQLKRFNKSLNAQLRSLQNEKNILQTQNKKLLKILTEKSQTQKNRQKMKLSDASENSTQQKNQANKGQQRLTLMKIREQHSENLKMLKEGLIKEIQQTFDTMKIALEGIGIKVNGLSQRVESLQKLAWTKIRKTHVQTQSITISIRQGGDTTNANTNEGQPFTDRSYLPSRKNNSQIYIEEGPASSHERHSRDQFSRMEQIQIQSEKNLSNLVQQELNAVKSELHQLRFKYQKLCLDTSQLGFSQRLQNQEPSQLTQKYKQILSQLQKKQKEITILYNQIKIIEEQHQSQSRRKDEWIKQKQIQLQKVKQIQQEQLSEIRTDTQLKVKLLVQNYEKQLQILKKQISSQNASLNVTNESMTIQKSETNKKLQEMIIKNNLLQVQNKDLNQKIRKLNEQINIKQQNLQKIKRSLEQEMENVKQDYDNNRKKRQQFQQQTLLKISQLSQQKIQIQTLRNELLTKNQQFSQIKLQFQLLVEKFQKQTIQNEKLRNKLNQKQNQVIKLRQLVAEWNSFTFLQQIDNIKRMIGQNNKQQKQTLDEQMISRQAQIAQLTKYRYENQNLRRQFIQKEQLVIKMKSRIVQLQNLNELNRRKYDELNKLYEQILDKVTQLQKLDHNWRIQKQSYISKLENQYDKSMLLTKIQQIRKMQQHRWSSINALLYDKKQVQIKQQ